jgi:O-antigen/teichoic acid export membrane protein
MTPQHVAAGMQDQILTDQPNPTPVLLDSGVSIRPLILRSLSWTAAARGVAAVGVVVRYVIFARLLSPFDFGVVGAANLAYSVLSALTNPYFDSALVAQHDEIVPYLDTVWLTMLIQALIIWIGLFACALPLSTFFHIPGAYRAFWAIGAVALLTAVRSPASGSQIYRKMDFRISFVLTLAEQLGGFACGLAGIAFFGDWRGLMIAMYGDTIARTAFTYWYFPYWPRFQFDVARFRKMFSYGKWLTVRKVVDYLSHNLDNLVVGHLLGARVLGEYQMAFRLGQMPATEIGNVAALVAFPLVSRIGNERSQRWRFYLWISGALASVGIFYALFLLRFGTPLVTATVGIKWLGAVPAINLLCWYGVGQGLLIVGTHFLDGLGKPGASFSASLLGIATLSVLIYPLTLRYGAVGAAFAAITSVFLPVPMIFRLCRAATKRYV